MKNNINYKKTSNFEIAENFYYMWIDICNFLKDNNEDFYIFIPYQNEKYRFKFLRNNALISMSLNFTGLITNDLDKIINNIKFNRTKNSISTYPSIKIIHKYNYYLKNHFNLPSLTYISEFKFEKYASSSLTNENYIIILEKFIESINSKDKKKIQQAILKWNIKNKFNLVSIWKMLNKIFIIEFKFEFSNKLTNLNVNCDYTGKLFIDTIEHYDMVEKHNDYMKKQREFRKKEK